MKSRAFTKRVFSLELSEEELGIIAGALYCANSEDIKCFVDKYKYPCSGYSFDEVAELQEKLSEEVNKLIEGKEVFEEIESCMEGMNYCPKCNIAMENDYFYYDEEREEYMEIWICPQCGYREDIPE